MSTELDALWEGFSAIGDEPRMILMWAIAGALLFVGVAKKKEPLLLVPISMGILFANLPLGELIREGGNGEPAGLLKTFQTVGMETDIFPLLIFLGVGAATDFTPMLSNPKTLLLGAGAQAGVFVALLGALLLGMTDLFDFGLLEASSIGIIGGADGPTTIFIATRMRELGESLPNVEVRDIVGATAVAAYSYMALVPIIQPPIIKLLTTKKERLIRMEYSAKPVSKRAQVLFPVLTTIIISVLVPSASPLIGMLMLGNLIKVSGVVPRLADVTENALMNAVIVLLGLAVGATMPANIFLQPETIGIFLLGLFAFMTATVAGILLAKLMNLLSREKINPMIGAAGVSAVPMAARVVQDMGQKEDPENFLLMHAMGPNVAGVIGTATVAGVLLAVVENML
ncbi:MAG TPA: sodium ion-translocating decarboxylase subunit beta [Dehalococcoidia bacterium]|jgi:oxaloacetate decarboxylase beta subunit|nr:glutaconyl-CoA decarboxylase subunit beta [Chloroflexota bacterium]MDP6056323.1 sodium ion-translocating decarboxylase subunit beta [Dehalococcoidia bacterium]MDP7090160.1 sodium ion-translocating decarboxylase subunit beta [Dehalococcoidia bacterium]MDP7262110.1 sodium ion-translocating decarboxylase subunit beta [Dehalococcoidia bacterium]MDP7484666.1 sodium ion-translocating decarboxylase subunit beta [Dehalococcoidia bacterium]|tara:strand:- start:105 stop:1301 length:1197 start_codon:yes stop_codon:yes gene_type:complete